MIKVGTSGYYFKDWVGTFYPEGISTDDMLTYYADTFNVVEINTTYYGVPKPEVFESMANRTGEGFEFIIKANKATTHDFDDKSIHEDFCNSLQPLRAAGKLSGILMQFPWGFKNTERNRKYLSAVATSYNDITVFCEFRHNSWNRPEVFDFINIIKINFVSVDEPQIGNMMPPVAKAIGNYAYVRFHGRNTKTWWGKTGDRYDYFYTEEELEPWIERIEELEKGVWKLYAFFNNCHRGYSVRNALMFQDMLRSKGLVFND